MTDRLTQLRKLYDVDPKDPFVSYGIALEHAKQGETDEALRWLDQTLTIDAQYCYAYFQKGRLLSEVGRDEEAKAALREGVQQAQQAGDAHAASEISELLASIE
ncbi:tetratricopeptide repeat protein [Phycisphaerales bacterium AB-hyl4]|uniref:Tetratricopeptide repeat protein n=1 Tax=Natronomicrosphaera hydrolytica TaxID=3242702 RepID=A0ABV4U0W9_9BACT